MTLNPPYAIAKLKRYIRQKNPARFDLIEQIHQQIEADMPPFISPRYEDLVETSLLSQWLENDLHLIAIQTLLDKNNYPADASGIGLTMRHYIRHNMQIVYNCSRLLNARAVKFLVSQQSWAAEQYGQKYRSTVSSLESLLIPLGGIWTVIRNACFDRNGSRPPLLRSGYSFRTIVLLATEYCRLVFQPYDMPLLCDENTGHLIDVLLISIIADESELRLIEAAFEALSLMLSGLNIPGPVSLYLSKSGSWIHGEHAMLITKVCMNQILRRKQPETPPPFIFLEALREIYPEIVTSECNGLSFIASVVHAWKHDLCLYGLTEATWACIELLASISRLGERDISYDLESKISDDFSRLVDHKGLCIMSVIEHTLVRQIESGDSLIKISSLLILLRNLAIRIKTMSGTNPPEWYRRMDTLAQATSRVSGPCVEALAALQAYSTSRDTEEARAVEMRDTLVDSLQQLIVSLAPHEPSRQSSPPPRHIQGWWKHTSCFWHKCLCHDAIPIHRMKICKGCGLAAYCSTFCQRSDWREGDHRDFCKTHPLE